MAERHPISDLDLLAYADDPHGLDPRHCEAIEAHLRHHPQDAERVEIFRQQNAALRQHYEPYSRAAVPDRLYDALEVEPDGPRLRLWRHAAAAAIVAVAAVAGWLAGGGHGGPALVAFREAPPALGRSDAGKSATAPLSVAQPSAMGAAVDLPDVAHLGFSLIETELVPGSSQAVRLYYADDDGSKFTLLLRSRWNDRRPGCQVHTEGDVAIVSWEEGQMAAELTSRLGRDEALEIAEAVRSSLRPFDTIPRVPGAGAVAVGSAEPLPTLDPEATTLPQQIR